MRCFEQAAGVSTVLRLARAPYRVALLTPICSRGVVAQAKNCFRCDEPRGSGQAAAGAQAEATAKEAAAKEAAAEKEAAEKQAAEKQAAEKRAAEKEAVLKAEKDAEVRPSRRESAALFSAPPLIPSRRVLPLARPAAGSQEGCRAGCHVGMRHVRRLEQAAGPCVRLAGDFSGDRGAALVCLQWFPFAPS